MITAEDILNEKQRPIISVTPDKTVCEAVKVMVSNNIGAVIVRSGEEILGIYTERNLLKDLVREGFDPKNAKISDHMVTDLVCAAHDDPVVKLQDKFLGRYLRHLLIVKEGKYIGILSAGDVTRADLSQKTRELQSISWDYYEDWHWEKRRK